MSSKLKSIVISEENYNALKTLGGAGDSFNDVITHLIHKNNSGKEKLPSAEGG